MPHISGHRIAMQIRLRFLRAPRRGMSLLLLVLMALPGLAQAACGTMNVPDSYTTPATSPMASGGTITINAGMRCDPFGLNPYPSAGTTLPSHGTVTVVSYSGTITYTNNGDGATSDSFVVADASANLFTVNVAISAAVSPITISPVSLPSPQVGTAYSQTLSATGGTAPYSYAVASGSLPPGLTLSGATISGTPIQAGSYSVSITVTDNAGTTSTKSYTITVPNPSSGIAVAAPPTAFLNAPYSQTLSASGALAPYTFALNSGSLPPGLSLASNGTLSGTPTSAGTYNFAVVATDSSPNLGGVSPGPYFKVINLSITVQNVPPITGPVSTLVAYNSSTNPITLNITGAPATSVAIGTPATHGTATASGTSITYTPTAGYAGPDSFTYTATNGAGTSTQATVTLTVSPPTVTFTPTAPPHPTAGTAYSHSIANASGGAAPYTYTVSTGVLPAGLTLASNGAISGTPTAVGTFAFKVVATDSSTGTGPFTSAPANVTLTVDAPTITLAPSTLPGGTANTAYSQTITATGGTAPYTYAVTTGTLPTGITLSNGGVLSGTPTQAGSFPIVVTTSDSSTGPGAPYSGSRAYTLTVAGPTITLAPASVPSATVGTAYSQTVSASGGTAPYTFAVTSGALPVGLNLSSGGILSGTPTTAGDFNFILVATDAQSFAGSRAYAVHVAAIVPGAPTIGTATAGTTSASVSFTPPASDGGAPIAGYMVTSSPGGPTATGAGSPIIVTGLTNGTAYTFTVTATNSAGTGAASASSNSVIPKGAQTITFNNPGTQNFGTTPTLTATASSGLTPTFTSSTPGVCTITSGGALTFIAAGTCSINADQPGNGAWLAAPTVTQNFAVAAIMPGVPTIGTATAGDASATVSFTAPANSGGAAITGYTVTSSPGGITASGAGSPITVTGLTNGTAYTFTVTATNSAGTSAASAASNSVTPSQSGAPCVAIFWMSGVHAGYAATGSIFTFTYNDAQGTLFQAAPKSTGTIDPNSTFVSSDNSIASVDAAGILAINGVGTATITATTSGGCVATATVVVNAPALPTAAPKSATTPYNTAVSIGLTSSITGVDITAVTIGTAPTHGTVSVSGKTVTYTPSPTYYGGPDSFTYTATNLGGTSAPATVSITVGTPGAPTVAAKSVTTGYNTAVAIDLSSSITGVDITAVTIGSAPAHGTVSVSGKTVTYTPSSTYYGGSDSFSYTATNPGGTSAPATVSITIGIPAAPTAAAKSVTTAYNTAATIDLSSSITGVDVTAVTISSAPVHGTVNVSGKTVTYTPSSNYYGGTDSFTYTATNAGGTSAPATVSVTVGIPGAPIASAKSVTTAYDTAVAIDLSSSITGVDITGIAINTAPTHGTVSVSGEMVTYTPSSTYYGGRDSFTYTATNPGGTSAPATVTITVGLPPVPTATARNATTAYNTAASIDLSGAIAGADITAVAIASAPSHGTVSVSGKTVTYTPSSTFYGGNDSFTYTATNPGGTSAPATVTMTVTPLSVPTAQALSVTTTTGTSVQIEATAGATGPAPFTGVSVATAPAHGSATASGEQITYTPTAGFIGTDHFTYQVANHFGASAAATVTIAVTAAGQASAPNGTVTLTTKPGEPVSTNLGHIVAGQFVSATVLGLSPSGAGQVSISQPTTLTFTSIASFHGVAQITAVLTAADGHTATVDVLVLVSNQPDPSKNPDALGLINAQAMEAQRFADSQLGNIQRRLESVRDGNDRLFSSTLSLSQDGGSSQASEGTAAASRLGQSASSGSGSNNPSGMMATMRPGPGMAGAGTMAKSPDASPPVSTPATAQDDHVPPSRGSNGLGTWVDVSADFGSFDAYRQAAGFDADDIAISTGIDRRLGEYGLLGLSLGYNRDRSAIGNDGTRSTARGYSAALYGSFAPSANTYIDAILGGGGLSFDSRRRASNSDSYLFGQRNGKQWFGSVTAGYEYRHAHWLLSPYGRLQWSYSDLDSFAESGDVIDALAYGRQSVRTSVAVLGVRSSWMVMQGETVLIPRVRLEVGHNFQGASNTTLNYAFVPSAGSWNVLTNPYTANGNSVLADLGLDIQLPHGTTLTTDYNFLAQPHSRNQLIRLGVQTKF